MTLHPLEPVFFLSRTKASVDVFLSLPQGFPFLLLLLFSLFSLLLLLLLSSHHTHTPLSTSHVRHPPDLLHRQARLLHLHLLGNFILYSFVNNQVDQQSASKAQETKKANPLSYYYPFRYLCPFGCLFLPSTFVYSCNFRTLPSKFSISSLSTNNFHEHTNYPTLFTHIIDSLLPFPQLFHLPRIPLSIPPSSSLMHVSFVPVQNPTNISSTFYSTSYLTFLGLPFSVLPAVSASPCRSSSSSRR